MMKRTSLALLSLLALAAPAQALKLIVWDPDFKNKVAYGESIAGRFTVKYDKDYTGPVVALFSQTDDEKAKGTYAGLRGSYEGALRGGQLLLNVDGAAVGAATTNRSAPSNTARPLLPLNKVLQPYKLNVNVQPTSLIAPPVSSVLALGR